jgi:aryl-alcohol dehydrogenase-like predicted oxidoreductase
MVQMHWWDYGVPGMTDTALALADLQSRGLIREVALTNMDTEAVAAIVDAGVRVAANQVYIQAPASYPPHTHTQLGTPHCQWDVHC